MVLVAFSFAMRPEVRVAFVDDFGIVFCENDIVEKSVGMRE